MKMKHIVSMLAGMMCFTLLCSVGSTVYIVKHMQKDSDTLKKEILADVDNKIETNLSDINTMSDSEKEAFRNSIVADLRDEFAVEPESTEDTNPVYNYTTKNYITKKYPTTKAYFQMNINGTYPSGLPDNISGNTNNSAGTVNGSNNSGNLTGSSSSSSPNESNGSGSGNSGNSTGSNSGSSSSGNSSSSGSSSSGSSSSSSGSSSSSNGSSSSGNSSSSGGSHGSDSSSGGSSTGSGSETGGSSN